MRTSAKRCVRNPPLLVSANVCCHPFSTKRSAQHSHNDSIMANKAGRTPLNLTARPWASAWAVRGSFVRLTAKVRTACIVSWPLVDRVPVHAFRTCNVYVIPVNLNRCTCVRYVAGNIRQQIACCEGLLLKYCGRCSCAKHVLATKCPVYLLRHANAIGIATDHRPH